MYQPTLVLLLLHLRLPHLRLDLLRHLRLALVQPVQLVVSMKTWLLRLLPRLQSVQLDERVDVRLRLGLEVSSKAVGRDSLVLRGLSVLCSFLEEVRLVFDPPFCYSGVAT